MKRTTVLRSMAVLIILTLGAGFSSYAQEQSTTQNAAPNEVGAGAHFLVRLNEPLSTKDAKAGDRFTAWTLDPLVSGDGTRLTPGAEIRGHVDKVEAAHKTGRARLWLTFDDIKTPDGWIPMVAMVTDVPGVHSIRVDYNREGEIEANGSKRQDALQAAAAGALVGAAAGVATKDTKDAAMGAAAAAAAAFMVESGLGQELTLEKNTKIEVTLERSIYFGRAEARN